MVSAFLKKKSASRWSGGDRMAPQKRGERAGKEWISTFHTLHLFLLRIFAHFAYFCAFLQFLFGEGLVFLCVVDFGIEKDWNKLENSPFSDQLKIPPHLRCYTFINPLFILLLLLLHGKRCFFLPSSASLRFFSSSSGGWMMHKVASSFITLAQIKPTKAKGLSSIHCCFDLLSSSVSPVQSVQGCVTNLGHHNHHHVLFLAKKKE